MSKIKIWKQKVAVSVPKFFYKNSVNKVNENRIDSINKQKNLLYVYQELEEEIGKFNINTLKLFFQNQTIQKGFLDIEYLELRKVVDIDNTFKDIKQLIIEYTGHDKPEEEIPFSYFPTTIDFDKSESNETYQIYNKSVILLNSSNISLGNCFINELDVEYPLNELVDLILFILNPLKASSLYLGFDRVNVT